MKSLAIIVLIFLWSGSQAAILSEKFIRSLNKRQAAWTAGSNFPKGTSLEYLKRLAGTLKEPHQKEIPKTHWRRIPNYIPDTFDARLYWPQCESIIEIRHQGSCGSCWAFASAEVFSDRTCIASNGTIKFRYSPQDILACCADCGNCQDGFVTRALSFWVENGIVSGGDYTSNDGCQPYQGDAFKSALKPMCSTSCLNFNYNKSYYQDKRHGECYYALHKPGVREFQRDIMEHGPLAAVMTIYEDFYNYKSGVYVYTRGAKVGYHAVKIIGWGTENELPYWLVTNSWGPYWGNLGGHFKILRGVNHCDIEGWLFGAIPKL